MNWIFSAIALLIHLFPNPQEGHTSSADFRVGHLLRRDSIVSMNFSEIAGESQKVVNHWVKYRFSVILDIPSKEPKRIDNFPSIVDSLRPFVDMRLYPQLAQRVQIEGDLRIAIDLNERGIPTSVVVVQTTAEIFDDGVVKSLANLKFQTPLVNGKPISLQMNMRLRFWCEKL